MPKFIEFPDLNQTVEVPDDITDAGIDDVYKTIARQQFRAKQGQIRAEATEAQTRADILDAYENDPEIPLLMRSELGRRVASGMANMAGSAISAGSMLLPGDASKSVNAYGKALSQMGGIESTAPGSISEIQDVGDVAGYAGRMLAEQIPQLLVSGPVAGGLKAAGLSSKAAAVLAPVITTFPQEAGAIYQDITDETGQTGFRQRATAAAGGLGSAALEALGGESRALQNLMSGGGGAFRKALRDVGVEALKGVRDEALTEAGQEAIASLAPFVAGGRLPTEEEFSRRVTEAAIGGGLTGGVMSGVSKGVASVGDVRPYAAALQDQLSPQPLRGINAEGGLQPYTGARIEEAQNPASRINPNDVGSLAVSESMADARSAAAGATTAAPSSYLENRIYGLNVNPQVRNSIISIGSTLDQIENGYDVDQSVRDSLLNQSGEITTFLGRIADTAMRREDPTGAVNAVIDIRNRLDRWAKDTAAYNDLTAEAMGAIRESRQSQSQREAINAQRQQAAGGAQALASLEAAQADRFGPGQRDILPALPGKGSDIMQRIRDSVAKEKRMLAEAEAAAAARAEEARVAAERKAAAERAAAEAKAAADKAAADAKAAADRADSERAAAKISPPTESSLPADTGAAPVGGVPVAAPVPVSAQAQVVAPAQSALSESEQRELEALESADEAFGLSKKKDKDRLADLRNRSTKAPTSVTQDKAPVAPPAPKIEPSKAKAAGGAGNAQAAQTQGVANANQVQSGVEVSGGQQPQGSAQNAEGQAGAVQGSAGTSTVKQPTPPRYQEGEEVKVGDYVRVNKLIGQTKIYGTVSKIVDGVPFIKITSIGKGQTGTAQSSEAGVNLQDEVPLTKKKGAFLTKEENKNVKAEQKKREAKEKPVKVDPLQELINQGAEDPMFGFIKDSIEGASKGDEGDKENLEEERANLYQTEEGKRRYLSIEAAVRQMQGAESLRLNAEIEGHIRDFDVEAAGRDYDSLVRKWLQTNLEQAEYQKFSPRSAAELALRNAIKRRAVDKATVSLSSGTDLDGQETSPIEQIAASETGSETSAAPVGTASQPSSASVSLFTLIKDKVALARIISNAVAAAEKVAKGRLTPVQFTDAVVQGMVDMLDLSSEGASKNAQLVRVVTDMGEAASGDLQELYDEGGIPAITEAITDGTIDSTLAANAGAPNTGNQLLQQGEFTLSDAIDTVLQNEPQGSLLRSIAAKLLSSRVTARVVVLPDADFGLLGAKEGATAFYDSNPDANIIYVRQSAQSHDYLVMHEAVHAATVNALRTNVQFRNEIRNLRSQAISALGQDSYALQNHGSNFKDLAEFISEALSNSQFQEALRSVPASQNESLWDRFKNLVAKLLGITKEQSSVFDRVMNLATDNFSPNVAGGEGILYAAPRIDSDQKRQALLSVPGLQMDNVRAIERLAATQAQMVPQSAVTMIGAASNRLQRRLAFLLRQAAASPNPAPISSFAVANPTYGDVEELAELSHGVDKVAREIEARSEKAEKRLADLQQQFNNIGSLRAELNTAKGNLAAIKAVGESMLDDYSEYLRSRFELAGKLTLAERGAISAAAEVVRKIRTESNNMRSAMETMAEKIPASVINAATSNADILNYVVSNKVLDAGVDQNTINFLTTQSAGGKTPLESFRRLIPAIKLIQKLKTDKSALDNAIDAYENAFAAARGNKTRTVSPRMFGKAFASMDAKRREALEQVRLLNSQINSLVKRVTDAQDEVSIYDEILKSPEYKDQVETAIKQLNILTGGHTEGGAEGNPTPRKLTFQVGSDPKNRFEINYTADPAENEKNKSTVLAALVAIDNELQNTDNPYEIFKLKWMQTKLARYSHQMTDAALGINPFDIINRVRVWIPLLTPLIDRMFIFRQIPGAMGSQARLLAKVGMSMSSQIEAARKHPVYGEAAINNAAQDAIDSHPGIDPQVWDKEVLNELLGGNQERTGRNMRVGETTIFGHKITAEDLKAAQLQSRFADALYRVAKGAERGGITMYFPTLVQETYVVNGQQRIRFRYAYAGGALTTPRSYDLGELDTDPFKMSDVWIKAEVPNDPAATQAAREALLQDPNFLTRFAVAHVAEMNPEYDRTSPFNEVYRQLADQYAKTGKYPTTFDELVDDINNQLPLPPPADRALKIKTQLIGEITEFIKAYRNDLIGAAANDPNAVLRTDALSAGLVGGIITSAANNFTKPRGAMIAPTNFYTYTLSSDSSRGSIAHGVMLPLRRKQIESMQNIQAALVELQKRLSKDVKGAKSVRDKLTLEFVTGKKRVTAKQAYVTNWQLKELIEQMRNSIETLQTTIAKPVLGSGQTTFFEDVLQLRRVALVAQAVAAIVNYSQAVMSGQFVPRTYLAGYKPRMIVTESIAGAVKAAFNTAAYIASSNKPVSSWIIANRNAMIPLMRQFASTVDQIQKMKAKARFDGFGADELSLKEQAAIIRKVGSYDSPVEGFNDSKGMMSSGMDKLFSKWWFPRIALAIQNIPATADRAANILTMIQVDKALNDVMRSGYSIMENRSQSGSTGWDNWTDPANAISEAEAAQAGWSKETLIRMRQAFSGMGGLEVVLHDFWKRVNAAKAAGKDINDVPPIADEGFYMDVTREMLGLSNAAMDSMRPDLLRSRTAMSRIYNFIFTFTSWVNGWFSTLGSLVGVDRTRGTLNTAAISGLSIALLMVMLGMSGMWTNELRGMMYELVKGRPFPVIRLGDVLRDANPASVAKLFGASIALMIPYAGESVANALGAQSYRTSLTDIANLSQPLQLVNTFSDALMSGSKTGDWTGTFTQLLRSTVPGSDMLINRLPSTRARDEVNDAARVARVAAGPLELADKGGGGGGAQPTKFSNLVKRAEAAMSAGDQAGAQRLLQEAAEEKKKQGGKDPWGSVRSAIQSRSVDTRTFGRKLTEDEKQGLMSRMSDSQRATYMRAEETHSKLASLVPRAGERGGMEKVGGKPTTAIDRVNRRIMRVRKATQPRALRALNKKIKAIKPKKLRIAKSSAVSGSRLLRPKARAKAASALLPAAL
jgi:hypothetical protein